MILKKSSLQKVSFNSDKTQFGEIRQSLLEIRKELHDLKKSSVQKVSSNSNFIINGVYKPLRLKRKGI